MLDYLSSVIYFVSLLYGIKVLYKSDCEHAKIFGILFIINTLLYFAVKSTFVDIDILDLSHQTVSSLNVHNSLKSLFDLESAVMNVVMCIFLLNKEKHGSS